MGADRWNTPDSERYSILEGLDEDLNSRGLGKVDTGNLRRCAFMRASDTKRVWSG